MIQTATPPNAFNVDTVAARKYIKGSGFATGSAELKTHDNGDVVRGSYYGASGGYTCGGTNCTSQRTNDGIKLAGTWTWNADAGQKYNSPDTSYAKYGAWLDEGKSNDPKAGAWYNITRPEDGAVDATFVTNASGTATYNGKAVGQAAYYNALSKSNIGGAFTADAKLKADFDGDKLSGSITGFDIGGMKPAWSVELMEHGISGVGIAADAKTKWTISDTAADAGGSWAVGFYGKRPKQQQPAGVAGGFKASYGNDGHMVGAFGAER